MLRRAWEPAVGRANLRWPLAKHAGLAVKIQVLQHPDGAFGGWVANGLWKMPVAGVSDQNTRPSPTKSGKYRSSTLVDVGRGAKNMF